MHKSRAGTLSSLPEFESYINRVIMLLVLYEFVKSIETLLWHLVNLSASLYITV